MIKRVGFMGIGDADHDNWLTLFFFYLFMDRLTERSLRFCPLFNLSCAPHFSPPRFFLVGPLLIHYLNWLPVSFAMLGCR
jgi:hypothetical protein